MWPCPSTTRRSQRMPVATASRCRPRAAPTPAPRSIVIDPRVLLVGGAVALIGVAVLGVFLWMVPNAAAREARAACRGAARPSSTSSNPALCPERHSRARCRCRRPTSPRTDITGKPVKLSDFRGKVVLLNFWASWCGVCKTEKPALNAMAERDGERRLRGDRARVGSQLERRARPRCSRRSRRGALPRGRRRWPRRARRTARRCPTARRSRCCSIRRPATSNIGKIAASWGIKAVPESALIDRQGNIRAYFVNKRDWQSPVAETCLRSVIDERS